MFDPTVQRFIKSVLESMAHLAEDTMMYPPAGEFLLGQASGKYQGMKQCLDMLDDILHDRDEKEKFS